MQDHPEYNIKLDSYYYDAISKKTILALKIRNKRIIYRVSADEILCRKKELNNLHPIDLCIIGVLANLSSDMRCNLKQQDASIIDNFLMVKIAPLVEIIGRDYSKKEELIILRIRPLNKIITITAEDLYKNKNLIYALKYQDALSLGYSLSNSSQFVYSKVTKPQDEYSIKRCLINGLFMSVFMLSILLLARSVIVPVFGHSFKIQGEIICLPFLILIQNVILKTNDASTVNRIRAVVVFTAIIFLIYFGLVVLLPYPAGDINAIAFNSLYSAIINKKPVYILSFIVSGMVSAYTFYSANKKLEKTHPPLNFFLLNSFYVSVFFLTSAMFFFFLKEKNCYSSVEYIYSVIPLILMFFISVLFKKSINFI